MNAVVKPEGNNRDEGVVEEVCGYIVSLPPRSFFLFAGAGAGKTRTLVEVLRRLTGVTPHDTGEPYSRRLRSRGQSIRVITYTKNAVAIVNGRLGNNDLTSVSTIHSFCWDLIAGFDDDIREALLALTQAERDAAQEAADGRKKGPTERDKEKLAEFDVELEQIRDTKIFVYNPDRNTYGAGALQHAQVLAITSWLLRKSPTLRKILIGRHPVILIDESQDTMKDVLDALLEIANTKPVQLTLGLIGDHRQRIYGHGHSDLPAKVREEWAKPELKMNHRSQQRIVDLINDIWEGDIEGRTQPKTGVHQYPRTEKDGGVVRIFIGDSALSAAEKILKEAQCAQMMADVTASDAWRVASRSYKVLALEHKLAARRGGFLDVYQALDLLDPDAAAPQGAGQNAGPSMVRAVLGPISDLAACVDATGKLNEFAATTLLYRESRFVDVPTDAIARQARLDEIYGAMMEFAAVCIKADASVRDVLEPVVQGKLFDIDSRLEQAFADTSPPPAEPKVKTKEPKDDRRKRGWHALFNSRWNELSRYRAYLSGQAELATHQIVKGSEFENVMVVMDDQDAGGFLFSYDKVFGAAELSDTDRQNIEENKETTIDRTLRLLYVTCSRARESLALVLWSKDPAAALERANSGGWFKDGEVLAMP